MRFERLKSFPNRKMLLSTSVPAIKIGGSYRQVALELEVLSLGLPILWSQFWPSFCLFLPHMASAQVGASLDLNAQSAAGVADQHELANDQALVPSPQSLPSADALMLTPRLTRLPVELDVSVPVRNFRVRNLLALEVSHVIESGWGHEEDVPLAAGRVQLAWTEFEVIDTQLAVRVTRLA
jgi:flagellar motor switch protein FliN/FliY